MTAPLIPLADFFGNPERALPRPSPDGRCVAYLAPRGERLNVWVEPVEGGPAVPVTDDADRGVLAFSWSRDARRVLYLKDQGGDENSHLMSVDVGRPEAGARDLTPFEGAKAGLVAVPRATPGHVIVSTNRREPTLFDAARLDLETGAIATVAENPGGVISWLADWDGRVRAAYAQTPAGDYRLLVRDAEDRPFRPVAEWANEDGGGPFAFTADGAGVYVSSARDSDLARLCVVDCRTGAESVVHADDVADLAGPVISDRTRTLLGAAYVRDRLVMHPLDAEFARDWERLSAVDPGDPRIAGSDLDERIWTVVYDSDTAPGSAYLYDRASGTARFLFRSRPWLDPAHLAPMRPVAIPSRDGLTLRSYLTLPLGATPRSLPLVLVVHGGPWHRDSWGYDAVAQFLANRGYAVLQVNYRGSTGFGKAFMHAAEREFAGRMHDDLVDAVRWAVGEGVADPRRVAIMGGSYGGYAALVGATFTPDVFAAAVSIVGPSSLVTLVRSFPAYWRPLLQGTWFRFVGDPEVPADRDDMWARSPLSRVEAIRAPLLVVQGANDPRVTRRESDQIVAALRARGVPVEYLLFEDEGHGLAKPENRLVAYRAIERFLARHLGGRAEPDGA